MRQFIEFFIEESCGWCVPCRVGTTLLLKQMEKVLSGKGTATDVENLKQLGDTVKTMSRCGLGQTAANPILTSMRNFPHLYEALARPDEFIPSFDLNNAIAEACAITGRKPELEEDHT
jgi:[NiFe] hydrogenase diaphorase moiety large subunit